MEEAYRLTFDMEGEQLTLRSVRRIRMRVPRGQSLAERTRTTAGRFVEVRDREKTPVYRRGVTEIVSATVEYPTGDPATPLGRVPARRRRSISLLVPVHADARTVSIVEVKTDARARAGTPAVADAATTRDLITVDLPDDREVPR